MSEAVVAAAPAVLLYDGQSVLASWVAERLRAHAAGALTVVPAQDRMDLPFDRELRLLTADGRELRGLEALLHAIALGPGGERWLLRYQDGRLARGAMTRGYAWASEHRQGALRIAQRVWAPDRVGVAKSRWLFVRAVAVSFLLAFLSLAVQARGLFGPDGIVPMTASEWEVPGLAVFGMVLAAATVAGIAQRVCLVTMVLIYGALVREGAPFLSFQWDTLLLEAGFLAVFAASGRWWAPWPLAGGSMFPIWAARWLLFRLMFLSGIGKVLSGDAAWRDLTAVGYHYWTQPLPSVLGYWAAQLPMGFHRVTTGLLLAIEVLVPFLVFGPRPARRIAFVAFVGLMLGISATGSYGFLGPLTCALCLSLLDDRDLRWLRVPVRPRPPARFPLMRGFVRAAGVALLVASFAAAVVATWVQLRKGWRGIPPALAAIHRPFASALVTNGYGMFEVMTKERLEITIEGSADGVHWLPYRFAYKPQVGAPLAYAAPHMPRLDWMMWFAALQSDCTSSPWLLWTQKRLLEGKEPVRALFAEAPFKDAPPRFMRAVAAPYRFADTGDAGYWTAGPSRPFCAVVTLDAGRLKAVTPLP